jgi:hypothetical protein
VKPNILGETLHAVPCGQEMLHALSEAVGKFLRLCEFAAARTEKKSKEKKKGPGRRDQLLLLALSS